MLISINVFCQSSIETDSSFNKAVEAFIQNDIDAAEIQFKKLSKDYKFNEQYKDFLTSELYLARIQMARKRNDEALFKLDKLLANYDALALKDVKLACDIKYYKALNYYEQGKQQDALRCIETLQDDIAKEASCLNRLQILLCRVNIEMGNYPKAISLAKKTLGYYQTIERSPSQFASLLNIIGASYYHLDQLDSTEFYWEKALSLKQEIKVAPKDLVIAMFNMGIVHEAKSDYHKAIRYYKEAERMDIDNGGEDIGLLPHIYVAFTNSYAELGELNKAKEYAEKSLSLAIKNYGKDDPNTSFSYSAFAKQLSTLGEYEQANQYLLKSLEIRKINYGYYHTWTWEAMSELGENFLKLGDYKKSLDYLIDANTIATELEESAELMAISQFNLSKYYKQTGSFELSKKAIEKSINQFEELFAPDHLWNIKSKLQEAKLLFESGQMDKVNERIKQIYKLDLQNQNSSKMLRLLETYSLECEMLYKKYQNESDPILFNKIISILKIQNQLIYDIRLSFDNSDSKIYYNNTVSSYFERALEILYDINETDSFEKISSLLISLFEANRSTVLLEQVQNQKLEEANTNENLARERFLSKELDAIKDKIQQEKRKVQANKVTINELLSKQLAYRKERDQIVDGLKNQIPLFGTTNLISKEEIINKTAQIDPNNSLAIIEYFQVKQFIYCLIIQEGTLSFKRLPLDRDFNKQTTLLRNALTQRGEYKALANYFYKTLFESLDITAKKIVIIPDGILALIPFEILLNDEGKFLLENHVISYAHSLNLLFEQIENRKQNRSGKSWIGFAPSFESQSLNASVPELDAIHEIVGGDIYASTQANKNNYLQQTGKRQIIHLATHTAIVQQDSSDLNLLFSGPKGKEYLSLSEIYHQELEAELVVLSACATGLGNQEKSEGMMSLARAFHVAGVPTTVMSLWNIPDKETQKIMKYFYRNLSDGVSIDESLRNAKLSYLGIQKILF